MLKKILQYLLLIFAIFLTGCMLGPDYDRPLTPADESFAFHNTAKLNTDPNNMIGGRWWKKFADPVTDELVQKALENNTDLLVAAAGVLQADAFLQQAHGARWPEIDYSLSRSRDKTSFTLPEVGRVSFWNTTYRHGFNVSYILDFFGRLRRAERVAMNELLASASSQHALRQAIVAQVILTRIDISTQQRLLEIAEENVSNWTRNLEIIDRRYQQGLSPALDVYLAKENLANAKATRTSIEQSLQLTYHLLDVLLGQVPATTDFLQRTLSPLPPLEPIPTGIPAYLLDRRPDLQAAEFKLAAATERVGVNVAAMYPDLAITAFGGFAADEFEDLLNSDYKVYSLAIGLAAPIFKGGQLRAAVKASEAAVQQATAEYAGKILTAMREVEDALVKEEKLKQRITELDDRLLQARQAERLAGQQYIEGISNILIVLETERSRRRAENELEIARGQLWQSRVQLMLALGGDWDIHPEDKKVEKVSNKLDFAQAE